MRCYHECPVRTGGESCEGLRVTYIVHIVSSLLRAQKAVVGLLYPMYFTNATLGEAPSHTPMCLYVHICIVLSTWTTAQSSECTHVSSMMFKRSLLKTKTVGNQLRENSSLTHQRDAEVGG